MTAPTREELLSTFDRLYDTVSQTDGSTDTPGEGYIRLAMRALPYYGIQNTNDEICICLALGAIWADAVAADAANDMFASIVSLL